jgi:hypothetical protein
MTWQILVDDIVPNVIPGTTGRSFSFDKSAWTQETAMPLATITRLDDYRATRGPTVQPTNAGSPCVIVQLFRARPPRRPFSRFPAGRPDDDRIAGRNRDPG